ncbi:MAG: HAD family phosphatase [Muribaculaceae bacterium]|nr:HAD family phosphatase [Muribaculaceae bacterium]
MTSYKGIIFDFNGTLFWDSHLHKQTWREYSKKLRGTEFTDDEMLKYMFGRTNEQIIRYAIGKQPSPEMVEKYGQEKEALYRQMCLDDPKNFHMAEGVEEFLDFLKDNNIPRTIATMSDKGNVDFYIKHFHLAKWFDIDKIVYSNGKIPGKPAPDIYEIAAKNLGLNPKECIVIEDALSGIESARAAGIGKIIAICSEEPRELYESIPCVGGIIKSFKEFDRDYFLVNPPLPQG